MQRSSALYSNDTPGQYPTSYYAATANECPDFPALAEDLTVDVCVIGGGYTGLSTALHLAQKGYQVALLDAHRVGWGASGRNGGQLGTGQRLDQDELESMVGLDQAKQLWQLSMDAVSLCKQLIDQYQIDCDLTPGILHADHKPSYVAETRDYVEKLQRDYQHSQIRFVEQQEIRQMLGSEAYYGGSLDMSAAHLHPLNFALGLAKAAHQAGVKIYQHSQVTSFTGGERPVAKVGDFSVSCDYLVLACNGYMDDLAPQVARKIMPINNYIVATEPLGDRAQEIIRDNVAVADSKFVINYFRLSADKRLLFGGGESYSFKFPSDIKRFVRKHMLEIYPQLADVRLDYGWGGTLGITRNRMPYLARMQGNVLNAAGYSGHGLGLATLSGQLLAEVVQGDLTRFDALAQVPTPDFPGGTLLRWPGLVLAMTYYSLRDRLP